MSTWPLPFGRPARPSRLRARARQLRRLVWGPGNLADTFGLLAAASRRELLRGRVVVGVRSSELEVPFERAWAFPQGRYWERDVVVAFDRILENQCDPVVYDIGANIGYFTVRAAARGAAVCAFEPVASTHAVLARNVARNHFDRVRTFRIALSDAAGEAVMHLFSSSGSSTIVAPRTLPEARLLPMGQELVAEQTLDAFVTETGVAPPTLIKIDVEGCELRVLRGARKLLAEHAPPLVLEHSRAVAEQAGYDLDDVCRELERHAYSLSALRPDGGLAPISDLATAGDGTIVALPDS
jgi:FkbM family methyltransferase